MPCDGCSLCSVAPPSPPPEPRPALKTQDLDATFALTCRVCLLSGEAGAWGRAVGAYEHSRLHAAETALPTALTAQLCFPLLDSLTYPFRLPPGEAEDVSFAFASQWTLRRLHTLHQGRCSSLADDIDFRAPFLLDALVDAGRLGGEEEKEESDQDSEDEKEEPEDPEDPEYLLRRFNASQPEHKLSTLCRLVGLCAGDSISDVFWPVLRQAVPHLITQFYPSAKDKDLGQLFRMAFQTGTAGLTGGEEPGLAELTPSRLALPCLSCPKSGARYSVELLGKHAWRHCMSPKSTPMFPGYQPHFTTQRFCFPRRLGEGVPVPGSLFVPQAPATRLPVTKEQGVTFLLLNTERAMLSEALGALHFLHEVTPSGHRHSPPTALAVCRLVDAASAALELGGSWKTLEPYAEPEPDQPLTCLTLEVGTRSVCESFGPCSDRRLYTIADGLKAAAEVARLAPRLLQRFFFPRMDVDLKQVRHWAMNFGPPEVTAADERAVTQALLEGQEPQLVADALSSAKARLASKVKAKQAKAQPAEATFEPSKSSSPRRAELLTSLNGLLHSACSGSPPAQPGSEGKLLLRLFGQAYSLAGWPDPAPPKADFSRVEKAAAGFVREARDVASLLKLLCKNEAVGGGGECVPVKNFCLVAAASMGALQKLCYPALRLSPELLEAWAVEGLPKSEAQLPGKVKKSAKTKEPKKSAETGLRPALQASQSQAAPPAEPEPKPAPIQEALAPALPSPSCEALPQTPDLTPTKQETTLPEAPPSAQPKKAKKAKAKPKRPQPTRLDVGGRPQAARQHGKARKPPASRKSKAPKASEQAPMQADDKPESTGAELGQEHLSDLEGATLDGHASSTVTSSSRAGSPASGSSASSAASAHDCPSGRPEASSPPDSQSPEAERPGSSAGSSSGSPEEEETLDFDEWLEREAEDAAAYAQLRAHLARVLARMGL